MSDVASTATADPEAARGVVVVVGGSAGSLEPLLALVEGLPPDLAAAVLVVVHLHPGSGTLLPGILGRHSSLPAHAAEDGAALEAGRIYVAPADHHLLVEDGRLRVVRGPKENGHRPAIDPVMRSAARWWGPATVGLVVSGGLSDGTAGLAAVVGAGGRAAVQEPGEAVVADMPRSALVNVEGVEALPTAGVAGWVTSAVTTLPRPRRHDAGDAREPAVRVERPSSVTCPDCGGVLWDVAGEAPSFRCHVGHTWQADGLRREQDEAVEAALWTALRLVEERVDLDRRLRDRSQDSERHRATQRIEQRLVDGEAAAAVLWELLSGPMSSRAGGRSAPVAPVAERA